MVDWCYVHCSQLRLYAAAFLLNVFAAISLCTCLPVLVDPDLRIEFAFKYSFTLDLLALYKMRNVINVDKPFHGVLGAYAEKNTAVQFRE